MLAAAQRGMAAASRCAEYALLALCGALLLVLTVTIALEVATRYVVAVPLPWTEEVARFAMVWLGMLAAAAAARKGLHFAFRWGVMLLGDGTRRVLRLVVNVLVLGFLVLLFQQSWDFLDIVADQTATATEWNMRVPYAGLPAGIGALILVYALEVGDAVLSWCTGQRLSVKEALDEESFRQLQAPAGAE